MDRSQADSSRRGLRSLGPAIIVAAVVLGPGSILANSQVGWQFGYEFVWVLAAATMLFIGMSALSARLGVVLEGTLCDEVARRAGRPLAALAGLTLFLIVASFQFGNNLGILFAIEPFLDGTRLEDSAAFAFTVLLALNGGILLILFGMRRLYSTVEKLAKLLVGLMLLGFAGNLILARPSLAALLGGLIPGLPPQAAETLLPALRVEANGNAAIADHLWPVQALIGTTFSVGGAFYQAYLVRQKGWTRDQLGRGLIDSIAGISTLGLMSLLIMITAAAALHGNPEVLKLESAADVARALQPLFGVWAKALFCAGIFAAALSSFLINAMIGGAVLADGFGLGSSMDQRWPKLFTAAALLSGFAVALAVKTAGFNTATWILFAQAITVLGNPLLAGILLYLAARREVRATGSRAWDAVVRGVAVLGFLVVLCLSVRTGYRLWLQMGG